MNILIVGNVVKDVYLSVDTRTEHLEVDRDKASWLDLCFDGGKYHFYNRVSLLGGAAVALEVFSNFGFSASISGSRLDFSRDADPDHSYLAKHYRYILTLEDKACYFTEAYFSAAPFVPPEVVPDVLYIDDSAQLEVERAYEIQRYLTKHKNVSLVICAGRGKNIALNQLKPLADRILVCPKVPVRKMPEENLASIYNATFLAGVLKQFSEAKATKMARINMEKSRLTATLNLEELSKSATDTDETINLELLAATLMTHDKGILAADESGGSIAKKFATLGIPDDYEHRHNYRDIFLTTPEIEKYLSGVILFDETARDTMDDLTAIPDFLTGKRIIPGIKADQGLAAGGEETLTKGLNGLPVRLSEYAEMGLKFAKWRAAFRVVPSPEIVQKNCEILAQYAKACQEAGIVPIVEPEVMYDGDYDIATSLKVTAEVLDTLKTELKKAKMNLSACIYKISMVMAGKQQVIQSSPEDVGEATAEILFRHVPKNLAGVVFLSGGQTPEQATANLAAIIKHGPYNFPVTFSFARALQDPALEAWRGDEKNKEKARQAFLDRLILNVKAIQR